jgi:zinc transporter, ZIP family
VGVISAYRQPSHGLRVIIQHFAAGVIFSAVALQILPELVLKLRIFPLVIGFSLGVVFMIGAGRLIEKLIGGNVVIMKSKERGQGVWHSLLASTCSLMVYC